MLILVATSFLPAVVNEHLRVVHLSGGFLSPRPATIFPLQTKPLHHRGQSYVAGIVTFRVVITVIMQIIIAIIIILIIKPTIITILRWSISRASAVLQF